jgi:type VI protein secretion system component VasA
MLGKSLDPSIQKVAGDKDMPEYDERQTDWTGLEMALRGTNCEINMDKNTFFCSSLVVLFFLCIMQNFAVKRNLQVLI